jgi:hypothetical protein
MAITCAIFKMTAPSYPKRLSRGIMRVLILFIVLCMAWIAETPIQSAGNSVRRIRFPSTDVGKFVYRSGSKCYTTRARGLVTIPADADQRTLVVSYDASENLEFLKSLQPDDLQQLQFANTAITDNQCCFVAHFPHLEVVNFDFTSIGDSGIKKLRDLKFLQEISLTNTLVTDEALSYIAQMPRIRSVCLGRTKISDKGFACLANLRLGWIRLDGDDITDRSLELIKKMPVYELGMDATHITDAGIKKLIGMRYLRQLHVRNDKKVTDASVDSITKIPHLYRLDYGFSGITPSGIGRIKRALKNSEVFP